MTNDIFRTVRELIQSNKCVLMGNAVNNEGELYDDSVENLTAILAMKDSYAEMLAALETVLLAHRYDGALTNGTAALSPAIADTIERAITKAKGN
jgi:hypothetical protein